MQHRISSSYFQANGNIKCTMQSAYVPVKSCCLEKGELCCLSLIWFLLIIVLIYSFRPVLKHGPRSLISMLVGNNDMISANINDILHTNM